MPIQTYGHRLRWTTLSTRLLRLGFPALPSTTAELVVINLITQHDPQPDPQLPAGGNVRFPQSLLCQLARVEALQFWVAPHRVPGRFAPQIPQHGIALLGQLPQATLLATGMLRRDHAYVAGHSFAIGEARRIAQTHPSPARLDGISLSLCFRFITNSWRERTLPLRKVDS